MGTYGKKASAPKETSFYVTVNGETVALTNEQKKAWYEMRNKTRRYARDFGTCGQPDFTKCCGDCGLCAFQCEGAFIYADDRERYADGFFTGPFTPANPSKSVEDTVADADAREWLYREADELEKHGGKILKLTLEEGLSAHQISRKTGIAKSTVVDRLNRLLDFIREHREELI